MPRERMKALHFCRRIAREETIGGEGREGDSESSEREVRVRKKESARVPIAPKVSRAKGTS